MSKASYLNLINVIPKELATSVDFWVKRSQKNFEKISVPCGERMQYHTDENAGAWHVYAVINGVKTDVCSTLFNQDTFIAKVVNWTNELFCGEISSDDVELAAEMKSFAQISNKLKTLSETKNLAFFEEACYVLLQQLKQSMPYTIESTINAVEILSRLSFDEPQKEELLKNELVEELLKQSEKLTIEQQSFLLLQLSFQSTEKSNPNNSSWFDDVLKNCHQLLNNLSKNADEMIVGFDFDELPLLNVDTNDKGLAKQNETALERYNNQFLLKRNQERLKIKASNFFAHLSEELSKNSNCGENEAQYKTLSNVSVKLTPEDDFPNRSRKEFGLGEIINLSLSSKAKIQPEQVSQLKWKVVKGNGYLHSNQNGEAFYSSACQQETAKLALSYVSGPNKGETILDVDIPTIAPENARMQQLPNTSLRHIHNTFSVGFLGEIYLLPENVSYANIRFREGTCVGQGEGWLSYLNGQVHQVGSAFTITGNKVNGVDTVFTGAKPGPYGIGTFNWPIPWQWKNSGELEWSTFTIANHHQTSNAEGKATIKKKGSGDFSRVPADPNSDY